VSVSTLISRKPARCGAWYDGSMVAERGLVFERFFAI
jgi:hypothetical protein